MEFGLKTLESIMLSNSATGPPERLPSVERGLTLIGAGSVLGS
jgi:hypothetical protein